MEWRYVLPAAALVLVAAAPSPQPAKPAKSYVVHIRNYAFVPETLRVPVGATVTFVNDDDDAHTATASSGSWDSKGLGQHDAWAHRFTAAGRNPYFCTVHPQMRGTIVVGEAK